MSGLWVFILEPVSSPRTKSSFSSSEVDKPGQGSGNSVKVRFWRSHYSLFKLSVNHLGNTCFQPLLTLNLGSLSGLKIKGLFRNAGFQKYHYPLRLGFTEVLCPWWVRAGVGKWQFLQTLHVSLISVQPSELSALLFSEVFCDSLTSFLLDF